MDCDERKQSTDGELAGIITDHACVMVDRGDGQRHFESNVAITSGVLLIAAVKIRVIMREFMEVRHAPPLLRRLTDSWVALVFVLLLVLYWLGIGVRS